MNFNETLRSTQQAIEGLTRQFQGVVRDVEELMKGKRSATIEKIVGDNLGGFHSPHDQRTYDNAWSNGRINPCIYRMMLGGKEDRYSILAFSPSTVEPYKYHPSCGTSLFCFSIVGGNGISKCLVGSIWKELVVVFEALYFTAIVVSRFGCLAERYLCLGASCGWGWFGCDTRSMNNVNKMHYLWTSAPNLTKEGIQILIELILIQPQTVSITHDTNTINMMKHVTAITQLLMMKMMKMTISTKIISQWFSSARYDYTKFGAFLDMGSGKPIDDLIEFGILRLLDWNDSMTDIQLGMRFVDKVQTLTKRYMVRSSIRVDGTGNNVYTLRMNNKSCSCSKWQAYTLPWSDALGLCRENGTRADTYVLDRYS
ncbi:hypothetical protein M9H77_28043 [Catharanthus roseus]|uniref:Uncharacterized protein n=1 Tax=Catharanthus roseus TaxID=4058 RepID=A0ACC0AFW7_CATRO|nr:hypothetical protein M9H77_28043 [Catharanthus roseus]